jgi:chemotaxis protein methyltransferase CheR
MMEAPGAPQDETVALIEELLSIRYGLVFESAKQDLLRNRLRQRMTARHISGFFEYFLFLRDDDGSEWDLLLDAVTNGETYFFRETERILSYLDELQSKGSQRSDLRVLSAGCATGEEAYTLAITLGERLALSRNVVVEAIDLDEVRLRHARNAQYRERSFRVTSAEQRARYFQPCEDGSLMVREPYRSMVRFSRGNLLDAASHQPAAPYDVIFCRNVLIYFSETAIDTALSTMAQWLRPGGTLSLGHSESIVGRSPLFRAERSGTAIAYRRVEDSTESRTLPPLRACG